MKKLILFCILLFVVAFSSFSQLSSSLMITGYTNGKNILTLNNKPFVGSRIEVLSYESVIHAQPIEKNLMILNVDGTGGCFQPDNRMLFIQRSDGVWESIIDSYSLGGSINQVSMNVIPGSTTYQKEIHVYHRIFMNGSIDAGKEMHTVFYLY